MPPLNITDVRVRLYNQADDKLKAFATITLDNCFLVSDLKVIEGNKGLFVAMPSRKRRDGKFRDVAHPLNSEARKQIEDQILRLYKDLQTRVDDGEIVDADDGFGSYETEDMGLIEDLNDDNPDPNGRLAQA